MTDSPICPPNCELKITVGCASQMPTIDNGLAILGSASGLIYGIITKRRWWVVLLLMMGGGMAGRGVGYVLESGKSA